MRSYINDNVHLLIILQTESVIYESTWCSVKQALICISSLHCFTVTFHTHSNIVTQTPNRFDLNAVAVNGCSGSYSVEDIMNKLLIINNPDHHLLRLTELHRCGVNKAFLIIICPSVVLCVRCAINIRYMNISLRQMGKKGTSQTKGEITPLTFSLCCFYWV